MRTTFPKEIKLKELKPFNGTPADLESFDIGINFELLPQNQPLYYGGYDPDGDYQYKTVCRIGGKARLEGDAKKWLEDYQSQKKPIPNCWRKHADMDEPVLQGNGDVVEISLFDLLKEQFSGEVDARTAEVELKRYKSVGESLGETSKTQPKWPKVPIPRRGAMRSHAEARWIQGRGKLVCQSLRKNKYIWRGDAPCCH
ncbi:hypothetical protein BGX38DRAFT_1260031 [Terfezia claveryi]|nr:hypothetical protein BGX38DRAFT_1264020 [Terfezia claveryi]KAF8449593.1 hypothetical protein BGX38DRAFT_1260031 [Terfezia claveryi]